jgi:hypothetical protein
MPSLVMAIYWAWRRQGDRVNGEVKVGSTVGRFTMVRW